MYCIYGKFPTPPAGALPEVNHMGFLNPTTADSYTEAFAEFMAAVISDHYGNRWPPYRPDLVGKDASLNDIYMPWDAFGWAEELSIASVLWSLYQGPAQQAAIANAEQIELSKSYDTLLETYDLNGNGVLSRAEYMLQFTAYNTLYDVSSTITSINHGAVNATELAVESAGEQYHEYVFQNKTLTLNDAETLVARYDANKDGKLEQAELEKALGEIVVNAVQERAKTNTAIPDPMTRDLYIQAWTKNTATHENSLQVPFKELWSILRQPCDDFTTIYERLKQYMGTARGADLDKLFIQHGFWIDTHTGDGIWDGQEPYRDVSNKGTYVQGDPFVDYPTSGFAYIPGEKVGTPSNYQRLARRNGVDLPYYYVETKDACPFYDVQVIKMDSNSADLPASITDYQEENTNGSIYVPVPTRENALIIVSPMGVQSSIPILFTSSGFEAAYPQTANQGYYLQHDFKIVGTLPPPPRTLSKPTTTTAGGTTQQITGGSGVPGFPAESMALGCLIAVITLTLVKKRRD